MYFSVLTLMFLIFLKFLSKVHNIHNFGPKTLIFRILQGAIYIDNQYAVQKRVKNLHFMYKADNIKHQRHERPMTAKLCKIFVTKSWNSTEWGRTPGPFITSISRSRIKTINRNTYIQNKKHKLSPKGHHFTNPKVWVTHVHYNY